MGRPCARHVMVTVSVKGGRVSNTGEVMDTSDWSLEYTVVTVGRAKGRYDNEYSNGHSMP